MRTESLIDTGFLFATFDTRDPHHVNCSAAYAKEFYPILPDVVIPEPAYLILRELSVQI